MRHYLKDIDLFNIYWICEYYPHLSLLNYYTALLKRGYTVDRSGSIPVFVKSISHNIWLPYETVPITIRHKYPHNTWTYHFKCYNPDWAKHLILHPSFYTTTKEFNSNLDLSTTISITNSLISKELDHTLSVRKNTSQSSSIIEINKCEQGCSISTIETPEILSVSTSSSDNPPSTVYQPHSSLTIQEDTSLSTSNNQITQSLVNTNNMAAVTPDGASQADQEHLAQDKRPGFLGVGTNAKYISRWLQTHAIYGRLMFRHLNYSFMNDRFDHDDAYAAIELLTRIRVFLAKIQSPDTTVLTIIMAELHGGFLPDAHYLNHEEALAEYKILLDQIIAAKLTGFGMIKIPDSFYEKIDAARGDPAVEIPFDDKHKIFHEEVIMPYRIRWGPTSVLTHSILAYSKRGAPNTRIMQKVEQAVSEELQKNLELSGDSIKLFFTTYGGHVNERNARSLFEYWESIIPRNALRLTLLIQQTIGSGLTAYYTIMKAIHLHPTFDWAKISMLFPSEWKDFDSASKAIGDNEFYGFAKDLSVVRSTKYKNISFIAKELLVKANGETALNAYAGWLFKSSYPDVTEKIIQDYIIAYNASKANVPEPNDNQKHEITAMLKTLSERYERLNAPKN